MNEYFYVIRSMFPVCRYMTFFDIASIESWTQVGRDTCKFNFNFLNPK